MFKFKELSENRIYIESVITTQLITLLLKYRYMRVVFPQKIELMTNLMRVDTNHPFIINNYYENERLSFHEGDKISYILKVLLEDVENKGSMYKQIYKRYKPEEEIRKYSYVRNYMKVFFLLLHNIGYYNEYTYLGKLLKYGIKFLVSACDNTYYQFTRRTDVKKRILRMFKHQFDTPDIEYNNNFGGFLVDNFNKIIP